MTWFDRGIAAIVGFSIGVLAGQYLANTKWKPILIEHGAAYYTHDTGEFTVLRKDGEQ